MIPERKLNGNGAMYRILMFIFLNLMLSNAFAETTEIKFFRLFLDAKPKVVEKHYGVCLQQSESIKREDAWRCSAKGTILDPCFINPYRNQKQAFCLNTPWSKKAIELILGKKVGFSAGEKLDVSQAYPWAIELVGALQCYAISAKERTFFQGLPLHYRCRDGSYLLGGLQRCTQPWSILRRDHNAKVTTVAIRKAWF